MPFVVSVAAVVTVALVVLLADQAWQQAARLERPSARTEIGAVLGGVGAVALLALTWTWRYRDISPWARGAVALVCVHIAIAVGAWVLLQRLRPPEDEMPALAKLPAPAFAFAAGLLLFAAAFVHTRWRRLTMAPAWLRGTVVFAFAFVLLLGIWLPIALPDYSEMYWYRREVERLYLARILCPPALVALATAVVVLRRTTWDGYFWPVSMTVVCIFLVGAMAARADAPPTAMVVYSNYVHVLFASAWFALTALAALAWTHARVLRSNRVDTARPAPWVQRGIVEAPAAEPVVGAWHIDGWLAGLRTSLEGFTLRTERGDALRVPDGARLVAPVPASTVGAWRDEHITALRAGDEVVVSGFVAADGDGPYRTAGLPVPGSDGLVVTARRRRDDSIGRDVVLVLYRPCVLFLIVAALAALPGIVGNEQDPEPPSYRHYEH